MAFNLSCPNCGERSAYDFSFGGALLDRPAPEDTEATWTHYNYYRRNPAGVQREWWYHRYGCRRWIMVNRHTVTNRVEHTSWPHESAS